MKRKTQNQKSKTSRAVFLDRDGVINRALVREGKPYPPSSFSEFKLLPDVHLACKRLKDAGYKLVVVTNQPDVGRGNLLQSTVEEMHALLQVSLPIDRVEVCYHPGRGLSNCECRKPLPGMLLSASKAMGLDLSKSWIIGDRFGDIICGQSVGCRAILIGEGYNERQDITPDFRADSLNEAATIILNSTN